MAPPPSQVNQPEVDARAGWLTATVVSMDGSRAHRVALTTYLCVNRLVNRWDTTGPQCSSRLSMAGC